jgi:hypothetical protein
MQITWLAGNRGWLDAPAAASLARVDAQIGHYLQITESGRNRSQQQAHWDRYLAYLAGGPWAALAAKPGSSPHEFGNAIDTNERLVAILHDHGWRRPLASEPWHFVYNYRLDNHRFGGSASGSSVVPTPKPEEDFLSALAPAQQGQLYDANIRHSPAGDYYMSDAILGDVRSYGAGLVARTDAANTRLEALLAMQKAQAEGGAAQADIEAFDAKLRESEARTVAATKQAVEAATTALRAEIAASVAEAFGLPAEQLNDAIDEAFGRVYANYKPAA